jgi:hypothetical protein
VDYVRHPNHTQLKRLAFLALLFAVSVLGFGCTAGEREEVLDRYDSGAKKTVAIYSGSGSDEKFIERHTYGEAGALIMVEDIQSGTTQNYIDLNDAYNGLLGFLEGGTWNRSAEVASDIEGERAYIEESLRVVDDTLEYTLRGQDPEAGPDTFLLARNRFRITARTSSTFRVDAWLTYEGDFVIQDRGQALKALRGRDTGFARDTVQVRGRDRILISDQYSIGLFRIGEGEGLSEAMRGEAYVRATRQVTTTDK